MADLNTADHADSDVTAEQPERPTPVLPRGHSEQWSSLDLLDMATVGPEDIRLTRYFWVLHAPDGFKRVLDAKTQETGSK